VSPRRQYRTTRPLPAQIADAGQSLLDLGSHDATLAGRLTRLVGVVAVEASRSPRFARALADALTSDALASDEQEPHRSTVDVPTTEAFASSAAAADAESTSEASGRRKSRPGRAGRRNPGPLDPFSVYADVGEAGLRQVLAPLDLEQLRDIVAQHGMDHDRLAMKWKAMDRVIERIIERVEAVSSKGFAFRSGAEANVDAEPSTGQSAG
jgi:hypothetical protein